MAWVMWNSHLQQCHRVSWQLLSYYHNLHVDYTYGNQGGGSLGGDTGFLVPDGLKDVRP